MEWLWQIAAKKAVASGVQAVIAVLGSQAVLNTLNGIGIKITVDPLLATASAYGALEFLRNWLKNKVGIRFL